MTSMRQKNDEIEMTNEERRNSKGKIIFIVCQILILSKIILREIDVARDMSFNWMAMSIYALNDRLFS